MLWGVQASVFVAHRLSCSVARGIFLDQGSNPCVSCIDRWNLYPRAIREAPLSPFLKVPSWLSACLSPHGYSLQWQGVSAQTTSLPLLRLPLSCLPHSWSFCFIFLLPSCIGNLPPAIATLLASSWVFEITMVFHCVLSVARSEL